MERISSGISKKKKKEKLLASSQKLIDLLKELQSEWQISVPGLLIELTIHANFLRRIRHQFRASKMVQRSQSMQKCARRLQGLRQFKFRDDLICPGRSFAESAEALLIRIGNFGQLLSQLATYAQLVWEGTSQALAQEHYFFFGTDLSMMATTSRVWVMAKALLDSIRKFWHKIRECLVESGVEKNKLRQLSAVFPGDAIQQSPSIGTASTSEFISAKESSTCTKNLLNEQKNKKIPRKYSNEDETIRAEDCSLDVPKSSIVKTSGALSRFS